MIALLSLSGGLVVMTRFEKNSVLAPCRSTDALKGLGQKDWDSINGSIHHFRPA
jgi:hypothetical protein